MGEPKGWVYWNCGTCGLGNTGQPGELDKHLLTHEHLVAEIRRAKTQRAKLYRDLEENEARLHKLWSKVGGQ